MKILATLLAVWVTISLADLSESEAPETEIHDMAGEEHFYKKYKKAHYYHPVPVYHQPVYYHPRPVYYHPRPVYHHPVPVYKKKYHKG